MKGKNATILKNTHLVLASILACPLFLGPLMIQAKNCVNKSLGKQSSRRVWRMVGKCQINWPAPHRAPSLCDPFLGIEPPSSTTSAFCMPTLLVLHVYLLVLHVNLLILHMLLLQLPFLHLSQSPDSKVEPFFILLLPPEGEMRLPWDF